MRTIIVGSGRLASEVLEGWNQAESGQISAWSEHMDMNAKAVVVHAGSGRELKNVMTFCHKTQSPLIELSTDSVIEAAGLSFPILVCPNTNILMLKFMNMLERNGTLFSGYTITITESHQAQKTSVPGTAVSIAKSLGMGANEIWSVRDPAVQQTALNIPSEHLDRHAYHRIVIEDGSCSITMETRVQGKTPYAVGVSRIVSAVHSQKLESRHYTINDFVEKGWI